jgi:hypothetical protein
MAASVAVLAQLLVLVGCVKAAREFFREREWSLALMFCGFSVWVSVVVGVSCNSLWRLLCTF